MHEQYIQLYSAVPAGYQRVRHVLHGGDVPMLRSPKRLHLADAGFALRGGFDLAALHLVDEIEFTTEPPIDVPGPVPLTRLRMRWDPLEHHDLHPSIEADLEIEPIDEERTMVSLLASYVPPLGRLGALVDRVALHRLAEAGMRDFFVKVVRQIKAAANAASGTR